jgi:predicted Zn-dependent peptidase
MKAPHREYTLDNGLHVVLQKTPTQTVAAQIRVHYGRANEPEGYEGLAHFFEHCFINGGTQKYTPEKQKELQNQLGMHNAATNIKETVFLADMLTEDLPLFLDLAAENMFHPRLNEEKIEQERQRVLREISMERSSTQFSDIQAYHKALLGNHPLTKRVLGCDKVISHATQEDLRVIHTQGYGARNMDLFLAGDLPRDIDTLIAQQFANKIARVCTKIEFGEAEPLRQKTILHYKAEDLLNQDNQEESNANIYLSILCPSEESDKFATMQILTIILGGGGNSRIFTAVSEQKGLAYAINSGYTGSCGQGILQVSGNVSAARHEEVIDTIFEEMKKLREKSVSEQELQTIIRRGRYQLGKDFESNQGHIQAMRTKIDTERTPEIAIRNWEAVTPQDIQEAAQKYFPENREDGTYVLLIRDPLKA